MVTIQQDAILTVNGVADLRQTGQGGVVCVDSIFAVNQMQKVAMVSRARKDQEMAPSSSASFWMEAICADSTSSGIHGNPSDRPSAEPEGEGSLEVASAARLLLPGRCTMSKHMGGCAA